MAEEKVLRRSIDSRRMEDQGTIENIEYNSWSGGQKNVRVGPALEFLGELSAEIPVFEGDQLYIFKPTAGVGYVEMSETTGIGIVGSAPAQNTFPVLGETFTVYSAANYKFIKGAAGIYLYKMKDENKVRVNP